MLIPWKPKIPRTALKLRQIPDVLRATPQNSFSTMSSDITLYSAPTPNGLKVSIALEELGLPYKTVPIDLMKAEQKQDWFLKINPNGRIPAIKDGEQRVFESGAILLYLVDKYDTERKISYAPGTPGYIEQLSWLMFQMGGVGPMQGQANFFRTFANSHSDLGIKRYLNETKRLYSVLESRLKESPYLAGSKYTIADIATFTWIRSAPIILGIDISEWSALNAWKDKIAEREAVQKGQDVPKRAVSIEEFAERMKQARAKIDALENTDRS